MPPTDFLFPKSRWTPALKVLAFMGILGAAWLAGIEVESLLWMGGVALIPLVGFAIWDARDARRRRELRDRWRAQAAELAAWAREHGWTVGRVMDPALIDDVEQLAEQVDLGPLAPTEDAGPESWEASAVLTKATDAGALLLVAGRRGRDARLWGQLSTDARCAPMRLEVRTRKKRMFLSGTEPELSDGSSLYDVLDGAEPIAHLSLTPTRVVLSRPGAPTPDALSDVADRLVALEPRLPRDAGPA